MLDQGEGDIAIETPNEGQGGVTPRICVDMPVCEK